MKNIPKVIYLNFEERGEDFKDHTQTTWSEEKINDNDIRFVLSDNSVIHSVSYCECTNRTDNWYDDNSRNWCFDCEKEIKDSCS